MRKQIFLLDASLKKVKKLYFCFLACFFIFLQEAQSAEIWVMDTDLSKIEFEIPVLLAKNVKGEFLDIQGYIAIDKRNNKNNKSLFSANLNEINMNYIKYKDLLLSNIFFDTQQFPIALIETKEFLYNNEENINLNLELSIKGTRKIIPITINVNQLAEELVQIKNEFTISRTNFNIGTKKWSNTSILKDTVKIKTNLFLFKE